MICVLFFTQRASCKGGFLWVNSDHIQTLSVFEILHLILLSMPSPCLLMRRLSDIPVPCLYLFLKRKLAVWLREQSICPLCLEFGVSGTIWAGDLLDPLAKRQLSKSPIAVTGANVQTSSADARNITCCLIP